MDCTRTSADQAHGELLGKSEKIQVGMEGREDSFSSSEDAKISIVSIAQDEGGYSRLVVIDTRRATEVADAARFAEQARKERSPRGRRKEAVDRTAEPRTSQVSVNKAIDDTHKKTLELEVRLRP